MAHFFDLVERAEIEGDEETSDILFELTNYEIDGSGKDRYMLDWLVQSWWLDWRSIYSPLIYPYGSERYGIFCGISQWEGMGLEYGMELEDLSSHIFL